MFTRTRITLKQFGFLLLVVWAMQTTYGQQSPDKNPAFDAEQIRSKIISAREPMEVGEACLAAFASRRMDLVQLCFETKATDGLAVVLFLKRGPELKEMDPAFQARILLMLLRHPTLLQPDPPETNTFHNSSFARRVFEEACAFYVLKKYLPDEDFDFRHPGVAERFESRDSRLVMADALEKALLAKENGK